MQKKPCSLSEIQFFTLIKGMEVLNNYLRFQESLPLIAELLARVDGAP